MARVTVEGSLEKIPNRFGLVVLLAQRAKEIAFGAPPLLPRNNDKHAVLALRELEAGLLDLEALRNAVIKRHQRRQLLSTIDAPEAENAMEGEAAEGKWAWPVSTPPKSTKEKDAIYSEDDDESDDE